MKPLLIVLISCCLTTFVIAQSKKEVTQHPISYIRNVPSYARTLMPAHSKSLFWGKLSIKSDNDTKGFHLYSLYAPELKSESGVKCHFALDIFTLYPKPHLINRIFLIYRYAWPPTTYGMSFTWMDKEEKTMPLLVVRSFADGIYGPLGIEHFIALPHGWSKQPSVTNLNFGAWRASDTIGEKNILAREQNGLIGIQASVFPATGELSPEQVKRDYTFKLLWDWDREKFTPHSENKSVIDRYFVPYQ